MNVMQPLVRQAQSLVARLWRGTTLGVRVIAFDGDGLLLVRHTYVTGWHLPGGGVQAGETAEAAARLEADVVGLSALMTTTLAAMRETIAAARRAGVAARFMVGGAAVTERFAAEAGADGYAHDAVAAVKLAERLVGGR